MATAPLTHHVKTPTYTYRARTVRVIDGDSAILELDLGCHVAITRGVRLLGVNTPEVVGLSKAAGLAAKYWVAQWLVAAALGGPEWPLVIDTQLDRDDRYGRLLGTIWRVVDGQELNAAIIEAGHGVAYDGGKR